LVVGCALPPRHDETVWVAVAYVYTPEDLQKSWNVALASQAKGAGLTDQDVSGGRLLRVACGLWTNSTWGSYAYLPPGMSVRKDEVLELRIEDPTEGSRLGWNPVVGRVERFKFPGSARAHKYVPDWKERGLYVNFERIPLQPEQQGRYETSHSEYIIKCRQGD
jgi:hypothetical protein